MSCGRYSRFISVLYGLSVIMLACGVAAARQEHIPVAGDGLPLSVASRVSARADLSANGGTIRQKLTAARGG